MSGTSNRKEVCKEVMLGNAGKLEVVDRFCYLGNMLSAGGGCELV